MLKVQIFIAMKLRLWLQIRDFMKNVLRKIYLFPISPRFVELVGKLLLKRNEIPLKINTDEIKKILVVKLDEIGDFVLVTPFLRELRRNFRESKITLIVKKEVFNLAEQCPYVNMVIPLDLKMNKIYRVFQQYFRVFKICKKYLWNENFDLAIIPRWDGDDNHNAFTAYFSRAKNVIGYNQCNGSENLLTVKLTQKCIQHEVKQNLEIIKLLGGNIENEKIELWLTKKDNEFASHFIKKFKETNITILTIAPGAALKKRMWPKERFAELIKFIKSEAGSNYYFILLGSDKEMYLGNYLEKNSYMIINMIGKTSLRQAAAIISNSNLFIGNDSGLVHVAAAVEVPVIDISCQPVHGSTEHANSITRFGPWTEKKIILQPAEGLYPCSYNCISKEAHCIKQIKVEDVFEAVKNILYK